jgi:maleate isomerase
MTEMRRATRLGMVTPSSNTVLEPTTVAMLRGLPNVSVHFARFKVTEISLSVEALGQFNDTEILRAAELLAHAKVDVIAWNGTSAAWLGFERDEQLCEHILAATGIPACTSVLAFRDIFERIAVRRVGLVTPYAGDVQGRIQRNWLRSSYNCSAERHCDLQDNFAFADVLECEVANLVRAVSKEGCDAVAIVCTNMRGAASVESLERELGIPVYDSVATTLWKSLSVAGEDVGAVAGWGSLFTDPRLRGAEGQRQESARA